MYRHKPNMYYVVAPIRPLSYVGNDVSSLYYWYDYVEDRFYRKTGRVTAQWRLAKDFDEDVKTYEQMEDEGIPGQSMMAKVIRVRRAIRAVFELHFGSDMKDHGYLMYSTFAPIPPPEYVGTVPHSAYYWYDYETRLLYMKCTAAEDKGWKVNMILTNTVNDRRSTLSSLVNNIIKCLNIIDS